MSREPWMVGGAVLMVCWSVVSHAAICGDATGDGDVSVTDAVQCLRAAADLAGAQHPELCDVDNSGAASVTDGVNILRNGASLPAVVSCGAEITRVFKAIVKTRGAAPEPIKLNLDPPPTPGSAVTLQEPTGATLVLGNAGVSYSVPFSVPPGGNPVLLMAVNSSFLGRLRGFFEIPLSTRSGLVEIRLETGSEPGAIDAEFSTKVAGVFSALQKIPLQLTGASGGCGIDRDCFCDGGSRMCLADSDCGDVACPDGFGCVGGTDGDRQCDFNSDCSGGICTPP